MAKGSVNVASQCSELIGKARAGEFYPVYLLMGDEPYYPDLVCNAVIGFRHWCNASLRIT